MRYDLERIPLNYFQLPRVAARNQENVWVGASCLLIVAKKIKSRDVNILRILIRN